MNLISDGDLLEMIRAAGGELIRRAGHPDDVFGIFAEPFAAVSLVGGSPVGSSAPTLTLRAVDAQGLGRGVVLELVDPGLRGRYWAVKQVQPEEDGAVVLVELQAAEVQESEESASESSEGSEG